MSAQSRGFDVLHPSQLVSSNDALLKMSDQLAAFPLTFNWQIAKQTQEEPAGLDEQIDSM